MRILPITRERYYWGALGRIPYVPLWCWSRLQQTIKFPASYQVADTCIVTNGIPRSGTYLVNNIVRGLRRWENTGIHINPNLWDTWQRDQRPNVYPCLAQFALKKLRNGHLVGAHLPWNLKLESVINTPVSDRHIKHIFINRDPRDTFISYLNWVTYSERFLSTGGGKSFRKFILEKFSNDDERLVYIIRQGQHDPSVFLGFEPWLYSDACLSVTFEKLFLEISGLEFGVIGQELSSIFEYLNIDRKDVDLQELYKNITGQSATEIGSYSRVFKEEHYDLIDTPEFRHMLDSFGYTW